MPELKMRMRHIRSVTADGQIRNAGGATVSALVDSNDVVHKFAIAYCNPRENFRRIRGRCRSTSDMLASQDVSSDNMKWGTLLDNTQNEVDLQLLKERYRIIEKYEQRLQKRLAKLM